METVITMSEINIRTLQADDLDFLREMSAAAVYPPVADRTGSPSSAKQAVSRDIAADEGEIEEHLDYENWGREGDLALVAVDPATGQRLGCVWRRLFRRDQSSFGSIDEQTPKLIIAVLAEQRGNGIGGALLRAMIKESRNQGFTRLSLNVHIKNPARRLYQRLGFQIHRREPDHFLMVKDLESDPLDPPEAPDPDRPEIPPCDVISDLDEFLGLSYEYKLEKISEYENILRWFQDLPEDERARVAESRLVIDAAQAYQAMGQYDKAEPLLRRALAIEEAEYGPDHPEVANALNCLASLLHDMNRYQEAEPLYRLALAIDEVGLGPNHPHVSRDLNDLALLFKETDREAEAEPLYRRALTIAEETLGPYDFGVAFRLNNLAVLLHDTDRLAEAEPLLRRALAINEATLGPNHPQVAIDLHNLASLLEDMKQPGEAEAMYRRALAIKEAAFGPNHLDVAITLNNLAGLIGNNKTRRDEAERLYRRALSINESSYDPDHLQVANTLANLGWLLNRKGDYPEARATLERSLKILLTHYNEEHPDVKTTRRWLAKILEKMGLEEKTR